MGKSIRVLIVEDSVDDAELLLRELRRGGFDPIFERVETPEEMSEALEGKQWDIVISDYSLPGFIAPDALAILKGKGFELPFIIVSGAIGEETAIEAMKAGAHDFIMKGNFTRLVPAIERELREAEVRRERKKAEEEVLVKTRELDFLNKDLHELTMEMTRIEDSERKRFAEILHDDIGQKLVAIEMGVLVAIRNSDNCPDEMIDKLKDTNVLIRGTIESIREMSSDLYPVNPYEVDLLGKKGLLHATRWYAKYVLKPAGLSAEVSIDKIVDKESYDFKKSIYRILQECFQNAMKHSSASFVKVRCDVVGDRLYLSVKDDGTGFSSDELGPHNGGIGLRLMRERVKDLNGILTIRSGRGVGTEVIAEFPLSRKEQSGEKTVEREV